MQAVKWKFKIIKQLETRENRNLCHELIKLAGSQTERANRTALLNKP